MIRVLVVDDSALVRKLIGQAFSRQSDFEVEFANNGAQALDRLPAFKPDVITLDVTMPVMDGLSCLDRIMIERPCPVIMVSSLTADGAEATLEALRLGAFDFVVKPAGAMSLRLDEFIPALVQKVRSAAGTKLKATLRLKERVRHRVGSSAPQALGEAGGPGVVEPDISPPSGDGLIVVGTSTGGPPALEALLSPLPASFPWPIVVAQHMPASFTGALAKRLNGICALNVVEVLGPVPLQSGWVYIGPGGADVIISRRTSGLVAMAAPAQPDYPWHPSADRLVRTAMEHLPASQLIGVLMTGMGDDGAQAMALLHERGGKTIAEAEETAVVWGMPGELVKAGGADWIVPVSGIAARLEKMVPRRALDPQDT